MKKKQPRNIAPVPQLDPDWLQSDAEGPEPRPPIQQKARVLPFLEQEWRDFERVCRRLAECGGAVEAAQAYGTPGQAQYGIDILVRLTDGTYEVWQTKRYRVFTPAAVREAVRLFLKHKWARQARKFVLAVACELDATKIVDAIEAARDQLRTRSIAFEPLDGTRLTERLRAQPAVVDDFFDRPWVLAVCPPEAVEVLATRLSRPTRVALRKALNECYSSWAVAVDPGLPIAGLDHLGRALPAVPFAKRYVKPDVLRTFDVEQGTPPSESGAAPTSTEPTTSDTASQLARDERRTTRVVRELRVAVDQFLADTDRALIAGEAGAGKSTLLRMLALDILSDAPQFDCVRDWYAGYVPVWVSFPLWARMASGRSVPPPLEEVVTEFLKAQSRPELADDVRKALAGPKIILLVDGLDEATDPTAAQTVAALLSAFVESRGCPALVTSRPHGLRAASRFPGTWVRAQLAPLSDPQRHALCKLWFRVLEGLESTVPKDEARLEQHAQQRATVFTDDLQRHAGIGRLSQTPLFLLALMELYRHGRQLPRSRFAAVEKIVGQLVEHQPQRRAIDSLLTITSSTNNRLRDRLLSDFAFALQSGELSGAVTDAAVDESAVARAAELVLQRQGGANREDAETLARTIFEFAEERAGLLVMRAPHNIGFLHLAIQELLAGRHVLQYPLAQRLAFVRDHAALPRWREPILYLLHLVSNEDEVGQLTRAIEQAPASSVAAGQYRDALLTDAVFADLAHDVRTAREIASRLLSEAELTAWGARKRHLLTSAVDGLASEQVAELCRSKIAEWLPNRFGYGRAEVLRAMPRWPQVLRGQCISVLMRSLVADEESTFIAAADVLAGWAGTEYDTKDRLLRFLQSAPSATAAATTLYALGQGWARDPDVGALASGVRQSRDPDLALQAIRIRAKRGESDGADFQGFFGIAFSRRSIFGGAADRDLVEHFATTQRDAFIGKLRVALADEQSRNPHNLKPLLAALVICDPTDTQVQTGLSELFRENWSFHDVVVRPAFPIERVLWTPELTRQVEGFVTGPDSHVHEFELYHLTKVLRTDVLKAQLIHNLHQEKLFRFWAARALVENWGPDDSEVSAALLPFLEAPPEAVASVAEVLPAVAPDKQACRAALLRALRGKPQRVDFLFAGLRRLGVSQGDTEAFEAAQQAWNGLKAPLYQDQWREQIIRTFPRRPEVRAVALGELTRRGGEIGAIADSYSDDVEMLSRILPVLAPQSQAGRELLIAGLETVAPGNLFALVQLDAARQDADGDVCFEATVGWIGSLVKRGAIEARHVESLVSELDSVGPDFESRRAAGVLGLAIARQVERFATAVDPLGATLSVSMTGSLRADDRYVRRLLEQWDELVLGLGGETLVLERLQLTPENLLPALDPGHSNAARMFELLMQRVPSNPPFSKHLLISALAHFEPRGPRLRERVLSALTGPTAEYWQVLIAGEVFAENFADDPQLRAEVVAKLLGSPPGDGEAALADILLRHPDAQLETALRERTKGHYYDIVTHFKLVAALSSPAKVVEALYDVLSRDLSESSQFHLARWVPVILRRIDKDSAVQDGLHSALVSTDDPSVKASFVALLGKAAGVDERLRTYVFDELQRTAAEAIPQIGFDLVSQSYRLVRQVLLETVG